MHTGITCTTHTFFGRPFTVYPTEHLQPYEIANTPKHIANGFTKLFTNTIKHATHKTNRSNNRATYKIQGYNITLTTTQVQEAIKESKNNNSQSPDKLNTWHLKHIGPLGLAFLTSMLKTALNTNILPHIWKLANIVPIPKPNKDIDKGTSYRPISLLSVIGEEPSSIFNCKHTKHTHATRVQTTTIYIDGTTHSKQHHIPKPNKDIDKGTSYRWLSCLC